MSLHRLPVQCVTHIKGVSSSKVWTKSSFTYFKLRKKSPAEVPHIPESQIILDIIKLTGNYSYCKEFTLAYESRKRIHITWQQQAKTGSHLMTFTLTYRNQRMSWMQGNATNFQSYPAPMTYILQQSYTSKSHPPHTHH